MNILKIVTEKLTERTVSGVVASLIRSATTKFINEFETLKGKERNETLTIIGLLSLTVDDEYRPTIDSALEYREQEPEHVTLPETLDETTEERMKKRKRSRKQIQERIDINYGYAVERHVAQMEYLDRIRDDLVAEFNEAVASGPNLDYKFSAETQESILKEVLDQLDDRYESLVAQSIGARGKYQKRIDDEIDEIDAVITLAEAS